MEWTRQQTSYRLEQQLIWETRAYIIENNSKQIPPNVSHFWEQCVYIARLEMTYFWTFWRALCFLCWKTSLWVFSALITKKLNGSRVITLLKTWIFKYHHHHIVLDTVLYYLAVSAISKFYLWDNLGFIISISIGICLLITPVAAIMYHLACLSGV